MNRILRSALAGTAFFMLIATAGAQERDYDWYHHDRDDQYRGDRWRSRLFWQVREDLDHVQASTFGYGGDQYRIRQTKQELNELQEKLANGRYDERELDEVIGALQRVVAYNRLPPRDRDILQDDLHRLREYREHHEGLGAVVSAFLNQPAVSRPASSVLAIEIKLLRLATYASRMSKRWINPSRTWKTWMTILSARRFP